MSQVTMPMRLFTLEEISLAIKTAISRDPDLNLVSVNQFIFGESQNNKVSVPQRTPYVGFASAAILNCFIYLKSQEFIREEP